MFKTITTFILSAVTASTLMFASTAMAAPTVLSSQGFFSVELDGKININTASESQLELLPGIGPAMAKKVVEYRAKNPFKEPIHLIRVKGIGQKTFAKLKPYLTVTGETTLHALNNSASK